MSRNWDELPIPERGVENVVIAEKGQYMLASIIDKWPVQTRGQRYVRSRIKERTYP
jgi:hypothetical protein